MLGGSDLRVPPTQGKEFFKALKCQGVEVRYVSSVFYSVFATFISFFTSNRVSGVPVRAH